MRPNRFCNQCVHAKTVTMTKWTCDARPVPWMGAHLCPVFGLEYMGMAGECKSFKLNPKTVCTVQFAKAKGHGRKDKAP